MTTLDGQTRTLDAEMVLIADDDGPTSIAGVMGGARSEVEPTTTRVLMEVANWNGPNIHRTSLRLGLRSEASARFEKQLQPEQALEAQAVAHAADDRAVRRAARARHDRRRRRRARRRRRSACATRASRACSARRSRASAAGEILERARVRDRRRRRRPRRHRARVPPRRRHPRGRPDRGGRRGSTASRSCPRRCPRATAPPGGSPDVQRLRRARRRRARGPGPARDRRLELRRARPGRAAAARSDHRALELENPMSAEQSQLRTTLLGSLLDVARRNRSHGAERRCACSRPAPVYLPDRRRRSFRDEPLPRRRAADRRRCARRPGASPTPRAGRLLRRQGRAAGAARRAARAVVGASRASEPFLHPGPRGDDPGRRRARRLARRDPSAGRRANGSSTTPSRRSSSTSTRCRAAARRRCTRT